MTERKINRTFWIDNLRGFSVFFVVVLHVAIVVGNCDSLILMLLNKMNDGLTPFRLGLMFFVSGLFFSKGFQKGIKKFISRKVKVILYPFLVWSLIYSLAFIFSKGLWKEVSVYGFYIANHFSGGGDITWFLHSLFLFFIISIYTHRIKSYLIIPLCWVLYFVIPNVPEDSLFSSFDNGHFSKSFLLFSFFHLGCVFSKEKNIFETLCGNNIVLFASAVSFFTLFAMSVEGVACANLFSFLSIPFFVFLASTKFFYIFNYLGSRSVSFYLPHYLFIVAANKGMSEFLHFSHEVKYLLLFIIALAGSLLIAYARKLTIVNKLFVWN